MLLRSIVLFCFHVWSIRGQSAAGGGGGAGRPDWPDYQPFSQISGWLKLHAEPANWTTATRNCQREEAQLASPWTPAFVSAVNSLQASRVELALLYSGLHATLPFVNGEPPLSLSLSELERCGVFRAPGAGGAGAGGDADVPCDTRLPYACYAPRPQAAPLGCRSKDGRPGYKYVPAVRGCLKLHARPRPWRAARLACRLEGAFLASPWSAGFVSAARGLQRALADDTAAPPSAFHAGVLTSFVEGAYSDVEGTPAISLEPALLARLERCGVFLPGGEAGAVRCDTRLPFLCYAPADTADTADTAADTADTTDTAADTADTADNNVPQIPAALDLTITVAPVITSSAAPTTVTTAAPTTVPAAALTNAPLADAPTTLASAASTDAPTMSSSSTMSSTAPTDAAALASAASTDAPTMSSSSTMSSAAPTDAAALSSTAPTSPSAAPAAVPVTCTDESRGYKLDARFGHCYKLHVQLRNWTAANVTCAAESAMLAVPNSDAEADHLRQLLEDATRAKRIGIGGFAVALGILYEDGAWRTVEGQLLSESGYARWWPGWPSGNEAAPRGYMESTGKLENYSIYIKTPFICEKSR